MGAVARIKARLAAVAGATLVGASAATPATHSAPKTLATLPRPVLAFAHDGGRIAWMTVGRPCGVVVEMRAVTAKRPTTLTRANGATCRALRSIGGASPSLALARSRAVWAVYTMSNTRDSVHLITGSQDGRLDRKIGSLEFEGGLTRRAGQGPPRVTMAGDGATLLYVAADDSDSEPAIRRVVGTSSVAVRGAARAVAVAVSGASVAIVAPPAGPANTDPAWSPDGRRIAFTRSGDIYSIDSDGRAARRLTADARAECCASWSPDSRRLAFEREGTST